MRFVMLRSLLYAARASVLNKDANLVQIASDACFTVFLVLVLKLRIFISSP